MGASVSAWVVVAAAAAAFVLYQGVYAVATAVAARAFGVAAKVASVGYGARLVGVRVGATDFRLSALPTGGYVSFYEGPTEDEPDLRPPVGRTLESLGPFARIAVALSGPLATGAVGLAVLAGSWAVGRTEPAFLDDAPRVGWVRADSGLARAGLAPGDTVEAVVAVGRRTETPTWRALVEVLGRASGRAVTLECRRDGEARSVSGESATSAILDVRHAPPGADLAAEPSRAVALPPGEAVLAAARDAASEIPVALRAIAGTGEYSRARVAESTGYRALVALRFAEGASRVAVAVGVVGVALLVFNLLPVPTLNGGQILFELIRLAGRPLSLRARGRALHLGLGLTLLWLVYAVYRTAALLYACLAS